MENHTKCICSIYAFIIITVVFIELYNKEKEIMHNIAYHINTNITKEGVNVDVGAEEGTRSGDYTNYYRNYLYEEECNVIQKNTCKYTSTSFHQYDDNNNSYGYASSFLTNYKNKEDEFNQYDMNSRFIKDNLTVTNNEQQYRESFINDIKNAFSGKNMEKTFADPLKPLIDFVKQVKGAFDALPRRVNNLNKAFKYVGDGIEKEFTNIGKSLTIGYNDLNNLAEGVGKCTIKFTSNLRHCILWYLLDVVGTVTYTIIVTFPLYIFRMFLHIDLQRYVNDVHKLVNYIDKCFTQTTKVSFLHFPKNITSNCYECSVNDEINQLRYDFEKVIPDLMNEPNRIFENAAHEFRSAIN
jgi:hypothetical protein